MSQTYSPLQIDMRKQNVVLTFSLAALFAVFMAITSALNLLDSNRNITFAIVSILFFSVLAFFYFNRIRYFSLALMFCFMFSLILGIPAVYLIYTTTDANFQLFYCRLSGSTCSCLPAVLCLRSRPRPGATSIS